MLCDFWLPQDMLPDRVKRHGIFEAWARQGHLTSSSAASASWASFYVVESIGCDPWNMARMLPRL